MRAYAAFTLASAALLGVVAAETAEEEEVILDISSPECVEDAVVYDGSIVEAFELDDLATVDECYSLCIAVENCTAWSFFDASSANKTCELFDSVDDMYADADYVSGPRECSNMTYTDAPTAAPTSSPTLSPAMVCGGSPSDVVFLVDTSTMMSVANINEVKDFIAEMAAAFYIGTGEDQSRIAIVTYAADAEVLWDFTAPEASNVTLLLEALESDLYRSSQRSRGLGGGVALVNELLSNTPVREGASRTVVALASTNPNTGNSCSSYGYSRSPRVCVRNAADDLVRGPDDELGTDDDVFLVDIRFRSSVYNNLYNNNENYQMTVSASRLTSRTDDVLAEVCSL
ncbi:Collagen alpha-1XX chain [Hondaea fermentalgiana]|uniref:Collagen alpha-1XX chain n=1 Tax=Hondaea fermentalgiana TaxID=2315210 RepID=A0A2R5GGB6_9STRA|nr:Collagen alpha-1XX chain [Hondaea fermentalgiana]|eukprot:GBG29635.1 Collagen alpha-1XX chain [Hondaea fermentalgiana]